MKKFVCTVCGYVFEGEAAPAECPVCHAGADKFKEQTGEREWAAEHVIGCLLYTSTHPTSNNLFSSPTSTPLLSSLFCSL